ncbi:ABC transporter permease [Thalassobacillus pellis]|uniref:ABC transporter permease n=1 Tax=Thalassobacillus pellis TaxID=748008 RepID=UPI00196188A9|nr:ABC transporter permease [Thalassobacillus pellis]MBM7553435.1 putative ABC transport system permease protein [Thalassobacillus pellis]
MTLFSLAKKNIQGNFRHYFVYFISMVFSMVIYFTFVSLQYSEEIQDSIELSDTMSFMFMISSFMLLIFVSTFIFYSNSFFTRRRKKELGLYSLLGLKKKTIGKLLFYENLVMGLIALVVGIIVGSLLSKLFSLILIRLMGSAAEVDFGISFLAIAQTSAVFIVIIMITSIQGYRLIYRFKLIELFQAEKQEEQMPKASFLSSLAGVVLLVISYWLIVRPFPDVLDLEYLLKNYGVSLLLLVTGTHLFFRSVTFYLLKLLQTNKRLFYKGTNLINISQLIYRIRGNARTFTVIALLSAATIGFFTATYTGYYGNKESARGLVPFSYNHLSKNEQQDEKVRNIIQKDKVHAIESALDIPVVPVKGELSFDLDYELNPVKLIPESTYNQAAKALDREFNATLSGNEAVVIQPRLTEYAPSDFIGENIKLNLPQDTMRLKFVDMFKGSVLPFDYPDFYIVISDQLFAEITEYMPAKTYKVYEVENETATKETAKTLNKLLSEDFQVSSTFYTQYKQGKEGNALNLFIFGFLGLVFLAATGSILYFKQLTEANEVRYNYEILRNIGVSKSKIRNSIKKQILFVFSLPLVIGIVHSIVILIFITNFISNLIGSSILIPIITAITAFILIYAIYYLMTAHTYNKIVNR